MAKAPYLTDDIRQLIAEIYLDNPELGYPDIREELLARMKEIGLDRIFGSDWPSTSSVGNVIRRDIRPKMKDLSLHIEDRPWSVVDLPKYEIAPEILPAVMKAWAEALEKDIPLTIRQVRWIARLYCLLKEKGTNILVDQAMLYAKREKAIKLIGAYPKKIEDRWKSWFGDAYLYFTATGNDGPLDKCMKSIKWRTRLGGEVLRMLDYLPEE